MKLSFVALLCALAFTACKKTAGEKAVTGAAAGTKATASSATIYKVNPATSQILWTGSKPGGQHSGVIKVASGQIGMSGGKVVSGEFVMDMGSIAVTDLKPGEGKEDLEAHLKGTAAGKEDHFFNVAQYPTAKFVITSVNAATTNPDANASITGDLTLKNVTKSVTIPAFVGAVGNDLTAVTPNFKINRTDWGINFQSKSVFDDLKDKFINDDISMVIDLKAAK